ncbi:MAG: SDR family oxidoreductase [Pirellulales bacterium]|nr:SDR family oxidoreductase [Pirellulales bacterium]
MGFDIKGKTALVTGANRGIGRAFVDTLVTAGAGKIYAAVRKLDSATPLVQQHGEMIVPVALDLSKPESLTAAAQAASDTQLVVSNAGILKTAAPLDDHAIDSLQEEMEINVYGLMRMVQAFAPVLANNGGGAFIQLNSVVSLVSFPDFATYCASKAAAYSMTQAIRAKLSAQGTLVVSVHPGPIETDMAHSAGLAEMAEPASQVSEATIAALAAGEFHVYPDTMARQIGGAYESFAKSVIETELQH